MKFVYFLIFFFLFAGNVLGQTLPSTPFVEVIEQKWSVIAIRTGDYSSPLNEDPFRANNETNQAKEDLKQTARLNKILIAEGKDPVAPPVRMRLPESSRSGYASSKYLYKAKIKNTSDKTIQTIRWEYVFFEKGTNREVGRQKFFAKVKIHPGGTKNLTGESISPPTGAIDANLVDKKIRDQYSEQVIIQSIEFTDGSLSKADSK